MTRDHGEKAIQDVWERTLSQVPTTFGRIAYLASLRNANTGRYEHFGLAQVYSRDAAHEALHASHRQVFGRWLNYTLPEQRTDLAEYLRSVDGERRVVLRTWMTLSPYRNFVPAEASEAEQRLFLSDLELILELLRNELDPSAPPPGA